MVRRYLKDDVTGREYLAYVSPNSVRYDAEDIVLLFPWLLAMREGVGPADPRAEKTGGRSGARDYGHFEGWCRVAGEIDRRLGMCHEDRLIAEEYVVWLNELTVPATEDKEQQAIEAIAKKIHRNPVKVRRDLNSVLSYIASGPCPRWLKCVDCDACHHCRKLAEMEAVGKKRRVQTYEQWKANRPGRKKGK